MLEIQVTKVERGDFVRTHVSNQLVYCWDTQTIYKQWNSEIHIYYDGM